jgi:cell division septum initiation protein DivIVA
MDITENRGPAQLPILSGSQLLSTPLGTVRKGGLDPDDVSALLGRAAEAIDELFAQVEAANAASATAADAAVVRDDAAVASTILTSAQRVADEVLADAHARAAELVADAERAHADATATAAQLVANARADAEAAVTDLAAEISALQVRRGEEEAQLEAQLEAFRAAAAQVHARAAASLEAAVAQLDSYVSGDTPLPEIIDAETVPALHDTDAAPESSGAGASIWADSDAIAVAVVDVVDEADVESAEVSPPAPPAFTGDPLPDPWELLADDAAPAAGTWPPPPASTDPLDATESEAWSSTPEPAAPAVTDPEAADPSTWPVVPEPGIGETS